MAEQQTVELTVRVTLDPQEWAEVNDLDTGPGRPKAVRADIHAAVQFAVADRIGPFPGAVITATLTHPQSRKLLDLSTAHLPENIGDHDSYNRLTTYDGVTAYKLTHGWLLWVPDDPDAHAGDYDEEETPAEVLAILNYARGLGCDYVLLDKDAPTTPDLPTWEW